MKINHKVLGKVANNKIIFFLNIAPLANVNL